MESFSPADPSTALMDHDHLAASFRTVRDFTFQLCEPLEPEDCCIQSMPDVSPTRWHLAHTTWFFEQFLLAPRGGYQAFDPQFAFLFNSYYNTVGVQFPRGQRGLLSRPTVAQVWDYRRAVDGAVLDAVADETRPLSAEQREVLLLGLHHEQQHQELLLTDLKHVLAQNPLRPQYRPGTFSSGHPAPPLAWRDFPEGIVEIGFSGDGFSYDNESPRHRVFLESFRLANRLTTCGEYAEFIADNGYQRPELWLSAGWATCCEQQWSAPLYWFRDGTGPW
jgi:ergothioneine biosynthesis protein EgtB